MGVGKGGRRGRKMGHHGTSADSSSHAESNLHLMELTEGTVTIDVENLF